MRASTSIFAALCATLAGFAQADPFAETDIAAFCAAQNLSPTQNQQCNQRANNAQAAAKHLHDLSQEDSLLHSAMHFCATTRLPDWTAVDRCMASKPYVAGLIFTKIDDIIAADPSGGRETVRQCLQPEPGDLHRVLSCLRKAKPSN